jgi:HEAT repeat protein
MRLPALCLLVLAGCASRLSRESDDALVRELVTIREFDGHTGFGTPEGPKSFGWEAKEVLVERGSRPVPVLVAALRDPALDATQKGIVRQALGDIGPRAAAAVPSLVEDLPALPPIQVALRCNVLSRIGTGAGEAVPALIRLIRERGHEVVTAGIVHGDFVHPPNRIRVTAAYCLGAIGPRADAALPLLADGAAQVDDVEYRRACRGAIRRILGPEPPYVR